LQLEKENKTLDKNNLSSFLVVYEFIREKWADKTLVRVYERSHSVVEHLHSLFSLFDPELWQTLLFPIHFSIL
jgi:hypothetical protein